MGKKRNKKDHQSSAAETSNAPTNDESAINSSILEECKKAERMFQNGNHAKALKIAEEACRNSENSSLVHRMHGSICIRAASENRDRSFHQKHFNKAMESAEKAVTLSPNSLESAYFYLRLLFENDSYGRVIQEGQRALGIQNPIDPAEDRWEHPLIDFPSLETRIADRQKHIRLYVDECTSILENKSEDQISKKEKAEIHEKFESKRSLAIWETTNAKAKFAKMSGKQISKEGKLDLNQGGKSMENKNANLTLEERRKKIEVAVAAARIEQALQLNSESLQENLGTPLVQPHEDCKVKNLKHVVKKEEKVRLLWNSMSVDEKFNSLKLDIHDLLAHFHSTKSYYAKGVISEAVRFAKDHNTWKVWVCCSCGKNFSDSELHYQHVVEEHSRRLSEELQLVLPFKLHRNWQSIIFNGPWEPVDAYAALPILKELNEKDTHTGESHQKSTPEPSTDEGNAQEIEEESEVKDCRDKPCWPIVVDSDRSILLERTRIILESLLKTGALAADHLYMVVQYAMKKLQGLYPGLKLSKLGLDQTHIYICFLDASQLGPILHFLGELTQISTNKAIMVNKSEIDKLLQSSDKLLQSSIIKHDTNKRIILNGDSILVDEHSFCGKGTSEVYTDVNASAAFVSDRDMGPPSTDDILRWLFTGPSSGEELIVWSDREKLRRDQGKELHQILQKNGHTLKQMCVEKCNQSSYKEAVQAIWDCLVKELMERKFSTNYAPHSFETILQKKLEELTERQNDISKINRHMLDIIQSVLGKAQSIDFRCEPTSTAATDVCDLDTFEDNDIILQSSLDNADTCIKEEIRNLGKKIGLKLMKNDTLMMRTLRDRAKLLSRINPLAAVDYQTILVPLVKSYILAKMEKVSDKEVTEKSKGAKQENVAQISPDVEKSVKNTKDVKSSEGTEKDSSRTGD